MAPLCLLLFGIIVYGYLMSFRQNMTQAAAEGARAGAIAPPDNTPGDHHTAINQATDVNVDFCPTPSTALCVTVTVTYDYEHHPLMPDIPLVSAAIPSTFVSKSTAQINQ
jgi:Flp pilus assembly protein TadG